MHDGAMPGRARHSEAWQDMEVARGWAWPGLAWHVGAK